MSTGLGDRVILVTGAAGAIGLAVARKASLLGATVIGVDRDLGRLSEVLPGGDPFEMDVGDREAWRALEGEISNRFGRLDGLVTSAASMHSRDGALDDLDLEAWDETLNANLTGVLLASRAAVRMMGAGGSIVHIGSTVAHLGSSEAQLAYTASKGGVHSLAREMAVSLAGDGIRVNLVSPGLVSTPLTRHLVADEQALKRRLAHIPLRRLGEAEEVADAVVWLLSDASRYVTGAEILVDGGMTSAFLAGAE